MEAVGGLLALLFIGLIFFIFHLIGKGSIAAAGQVVRFSNRIEFTPGSMLRYENYLNGFTYYRALNETDRKKFMLRLSEFMHSKDFTGGEGLEVTEEMKVLISASATQLMFGLNNYTLDYFSTIRIYPGIFFSKLMNVHMKGGASQGGVLFLSWKDFKLGYKYEHDMINLGLHELAHALKIEAERGEGFGMNFFASFQEFEERYEAMLVAVRNGEIPFLRKYGGTNSQEFWAVCIEHFFEAPQEFSEKLPGLYNDISGLLRQDPRKFLLVKGPLVNVLTETSLKTNFTETKTFIPPAQKVLKPGYDNDMIGWGSAILAFPAGIGIYNLTRLAVMTDAAVWTSIIAFSLIGGIIFFRGWRNGKFGIIVYLMQSVILSGVIGTALMLLINSATKTSDAPEIIKIISYKIVQDREGNRSLSNHTLLQLENNAYQDFPMIRSVPYRPDSLTKFVWMQFETGIFGIKVRTEWQYCKTKTGFSGVDELENSLRDILKQVDSIRDTALANKVLRSLENKDP